MWYSALPWNVDHAAADAGKKAAKRAVMLKEKYKGIKLLEAYCENLAGQAQAYSTKMHLLPLDQVGAYCNTEISPNNNYNQQGDVFVGLADSLQRLQDFGPNAITPPEKENKWVILLRMTFMSGFQMLLWMCVLAQVMLPVFLSDAKEIPLADLITPVILAAVIVSASALQWWSEQQAESMMDSLSAMQTDEDVASIRRKRYPNGSVGREERRIPGEDIVPGDIICLGPGAKVPADARIIYCTTDAEVDQAALTGESMPEKKQSEHETDLECNAEHAHNLIFSGTLLLKGNLVAVVYACGDHTLLGKIAMGVMAGRPPSSLEIAMEHFQHLMIF